MGDEHRCVIAQWMRMHEVRFPERAVDDEFNCMRLVVHQCKQTYRSWCDPEVLL